MAQVMLFPRFAVVQRIRNVAWLASLVALQLWAMRAKAVQVVEQPISLEQRVAREKELVRQGEKAGMDSLRVGRLWAKLASDYEDAGAYMQAEDAYNRALKLFASSPSGAAEYGVTMDNLGSMYVLKGELNAAAECRKRSMAVREAAGDKLEIARGWAHLAEISLAMRRSKEAEAEASKAYQEMVAVDDPVAEDFVSALITLTYASSFNQEHAEALEYGSSALTRARVAFAADSLQVGGAQVAIGYAEWKAGKKEDADRDMRAGVEALRSWTTSGHPYVLAALRQYSAFLVQTHRKREAKQVAEEEKKLELAPAASCSNCTISVYGLRPK
jgi:tetratricopeptide (TPR) repeat protein